MPTPLPAHPEAAAERAHLDRTLARLETRIEEVGSYEIQGFSANDLAALYHHVSNTYALLKLARKQVYFGRLDFTPAGASGPETWYFGKLGFEHHNRIVVVDWRAPVARLFSRRRPGPFHYASPDGRQEVNLRLKRHFAIEQADLLSLADEYDARPDADRPAGPAALVDPDAFLREILAGRGASAAMLDIVASLQEHQDDLIRADHRQVLVVQGVAGSGKTSIALHRMAYLLYPGNQTGLDPARCIIFGPNQLFLGYIANVLPELGVTDLAQTTLDHWALERLGLPGGPVVDGTQAALLSPQIEERPKQALARRSRLTGSLRFGRLLEALVNHWRARLAAPPPGLSFDAPGPFKVSVALTRARVLEVARAFANLPLLRQREKVVETLSAEIVSDYLAAVRRHLQAMTQEGEQLVERRRQVELEAARLEDYAAYGRDVIDLDLEEHHTVAGLEQGAAALRQLAAHYGRQGERLILRAARLKDEGAYRQARPEVRDALLAALNTALDTCWPALDPLAAYAHLLSDLPLLARLGRGLLDSDELELLHRGAPDPEAALDAADLPALAYLHALAHGIPVPVYDHIIVDEAQDVAPLYYALLRRLARGGSLTLLGDLAQGVYSYRGLSDWDEVREVFAGLPYTYTEANESYRSTHEIISFSNRILELLAPPGRRPRLAVPFERHGAPVALHRLTRQSDLLPAVLATLRALQAEGYANIALVAKRPERVSALARQISAELGQPVPLAAGLRAGYAGGLLAIPIHLAKGMEFEAVLLLDATDAEYAANEFDGRLLYVAVTRALHALHLFAVGRPNAYLDLAAAA
ncbi:MAG: AAA family ATPase [Anaerolineales bacterium]|nr:AAA family ATPase [Anaerolineales bacterium]